MRFAFAAAAAVMMSAPAAAEVVVWPGPFFGEAQINWHTVNDYFGQPPRTAFYQATLLSFDVTVEKDSFVFAPNVENVVLTAGQTMTFNPNASLGSYFFWSRINVYDLKTRLATGTISNVALDLTFIANRVPEPATWAMMIGGFGLAGSALRTKRRQPVTA